MLSPADLQFLSEFFILVSLVFTAALIVLVPDWRLALFALAAQYVCSTVLLTQIIHSQVALVRAISGALAAAIFYITARRITEQRRDALLEAEDAESTQMIPLGIFIVGFPFRLFALAFVIVGIIGVASSMTFLNLSAYILFSGLWLVAAGLLDAIVSRDALRLGMGILMFTSGFCILEAATEGSLFLYGLINISDLLLAVVIAHLATLPQDPRLQRRRGEAQ